MMILFGDISRCFAHLGCMIFVDPVHEEEGGGQVLKKDLSLADPYGAQ